MSPDLATFVDIEVVNVPAKSASLFNDVAISERVFKASGAAFTTNSIASCTKAVVAI